MVVSRSCIQMVLSQVWSKLVCSNGKWIRKSGLTQPLMWLKRRSGGNWNVQALQPCMFLEMYRPYNPVCFFCLVCTHKPGWCGMYPRDGFGTRCDMYPNKMVPAPTATRTSFDRSQDWESFEAWQYCIHHEGEPLENLTSPNVGWSVWNWWPQSDQEGEIVPNY